ncbi:hypothetical protein EX30DRAFT_352096 [Ascodesmis nigricans]|uniref:Uncharacterized protein n=1 Tax=Ascodesmis nigricans TaxID=341454 RepID=A0A4S2MR51_9PEZI|nr:hypothetical protein EX30DRAFT_352096 [Ascodesmis nigricans]
MTYGYDSSLRDPNAANLIDCQRTFMQCLENARRGCQSGRYTCHSVKQGIPVFERQKEKLIRVWHEYRGKVVKFYETRDTKQVTKTAQGDFTTEGTGARMVTRLSAQLNLPGEDRYPIDSDHTNMVKFDSRNDSAFQTVVTHLNQCISLTGKDEIVDFLLPSAQEAVKQYAIPPKEHVDTITEGIDPKSDERYLWVFHNLDYMSWSKTLIEQSTLHQPSAKLWTLVLSGSEILESAAGCVVRNLSHAESPGLLLFFDRSRRQSECPTAFKENRDVWESLVLFCTLLSQAIELYSPLDQTTTSESLFVESTAIQQ